MLKEKAKKWYAEWVKKNKEKKMKANRDWYYNNRERAIRQATDWMKNNPEKHKAYLVESRKNTKQKVSARNAVKRALEKGILLRTPCEKCRATQSQAHHEDYDKKLDVKWLCKKCHHELHHQKRAEERGWNKL